MRNASQAAYVGRIAKALSNSRLGPYHLSPNDTTADALSRYAWNVALCESYYPLLHALEITLRNTLDNAISSHIPVGHYVDVRSWLDRKPPVLSPHGQEAVAKAKEKLLDQGAPLTHAKLVAELDLGFWTGLLSRYYMYRSASDQRLWPHLLVFAFPHKVPRPRHPSAVSALLNDIRQFRNRVFHHEPIWKLPDLARVRQDILAAIGWISPETRSLVAVHDRVLEMLTDRTKRVLRVCIHRTTSPTKTQPGA